MSMTLTIRLDERDRNILEVEARKTGRGISSFVRELAHAEAERIRQQDVRAQGARVVSYLIANAEARGEMDMLGTPIDDLP